LGDSAEREDRYSSGCIEGCLKGFKAYCWVDCDSVHHFTEDWSEEQNVCPHRCCPADVLDGVAGHAHARYLGWGSDVIDLANLLGSQLSGGGGEVDAICSSGKGDVDATVDQYLGVSGLDGSDGGQDLAHDLDEFAGREVFLAYLEEIDAFCGPSGGISDHGFQSIMHTAAISGSTCDRVALHGCSVGCGPVFVVVSRYAQTVKPPKPAMSPFRLRAVQSPPKPTA
jgi:hypothetical protein